MPPSPPYPNTVRTTMVFTLPNNDVAENVLHWSVGSGATVNSAFCSSLAGQIQTAWSSHLYGVTHTGVVLDRIIVQDLRTVPYFTRVVSVGAAGGDTGQQAMPFQMAACMSLHTVHPGRRGRGRLYIPGLCEDANGSDGQLTTTIVTQLLGFGTGLDAITTADSQDVEWGVLSRADSLTYAVDAWTMDRRWDVQRRRANRRIA